ncbi:hypothetical protein MKW94_015287 [Papaver nudicaule]|uniref:UDP-glycosyltransferases domain-containing protein n=1 Tax=Papaver nudicaule TaxID=74823 RepID=A0AA41SCV7_PAPNU|nr:hypothetical protein [Papaver nudicaule]
MHYPHLTKRSLVPLKDESFFTNGYMDTQIDWIPGIKNILFKDLPSFVGTKDPNDAILSFALEQVARTYEARALIFNTFDELEILANLGTPHSILDAFKCQLSLPPIYTNGPLHNLHNQIPQLGLQSIGSNLWKEDTRCLKWLDSKEPDSVVYVNFGSIAVMTTQQLVEFAWGLANTKRPFLWIIRPDLVVGESAMLPPEFTEETKERGLLASWCPQELVLSHPSIAGFLTHCGWNSSIESLSSGVHIICWPFFADQQTNCSYSCNHWGRDEVEKQVRKLMQGEKGKKMKSKAMEWKKKAEEAISPDSLKGLTNFLFETISRGLPPLAEPNATQDTIFLGLFTEENCVEPFRNLKYKLNSAKHSDSYLTNGYLDTPIDGIPGMKDIRFRDLPSFFRTTDPNDAILSSSIVETEKTYNATAWIFNTFDALEMELLEASKSQLPLPPIYTIGPLHSLLNQIPLVESHYLGSNLWVEDTKCLEWLDSKEPNSVVYVNFGSVTVMSTQQLVEFAWGLAHSNQNFLWIIRSDLVVGESTTLPIEFAEEIKERGLVASWCPQEDVLNHASIAGFLTHCGWNSILESLCCGVPMICWPFFADQQTNCRYVCKHWEVGMEIDNNVKRDEVERLVRELMEGEKGNNMRKKPMEWKKKAEEVTSAGGSSYANVDKIVNEILVRKIKEQ